MVETDSSVDETLGRKLNSRCAFDRRLCVFQKQSCRGKCQYVHKGIPNQQQCWPNSQQEPPKPAWMTSTCAFHCWDGGQGLGVRRFPGTSKQKRHQRSTIAQRVVDSEYSEGFCVWSFDVEEVKLPQWLWKVKRGCCHVRNVVLYELVRRFDFRIQIWNNHMVFHIYCSSNPFLFSTPILICDLFKFRDSKQKEWKNSQISRRVASISFNGSLQQCLLDLDDSVFVLCFVYCKLSQFSYFHIKPTKEWGKKKERPFCCSCYLIALE